MPTRDTDSTLAALVAAMERQIARLDALERQHQQVLAENYALRAENAALRPMGARAAEPDAASPAIERLSRRWLLRRGMQAAAATVAAGVLVQHTTPEAEASHSTESISPGEVFAHHV